MSVCLCVCVFGFSPLHRVFSFNWCTICGSIHGDNDLQSWKRGGWTSGCIYLAHMGEISGLPAGLFTYTDKSWVKQASGLWGYGWVNSSRKVRGLTRSSSQAPRVIRICNETRSCTFPAWPKLLCSAFLAFLQYRSLHNQQPTALMMLFMKHLQYSKQNLHTRHTLHKSTEANL